jgi:hypothetical protein
MQGKALCCCIMPRVTAASRAASSRTYAHCRHSIQLPACCGDRLQSTTLQAPAAKQPNAPAVGERAAGSIAQAGDVVLIAAEVLRLGFRLEAAVVVVDDLPDDLIVLHGDRPLAQLLRLGSRPPLVRQQQ